jgi:hypothetical protein
MTKRAPRKQKVDVDVGAIAAASQGPGTSTDATSDVAASLAQDAARREKEKERLHRKKPSEEVRRPRKLTTTFSDPGFPDRIRAVAEAWGWIAPDGRRPNASKVVEFLVTHSYSLADAEEGKVPEDVWQAFDPKPRHAL